MIFNLTEIKYGNRHQNGGFSVVQVSSQRGFAIHSAHATECFVVRVRVRVTYKFILFVYISVGHWRLKSLIVLLRLKMGFNAMVRWIDLEITLQYVLAIIFIEDTKR
jgi:hypothetical protein